MNNHDNIAELQALRNSEKFIRIPPGIDVPITDRIARLIDTAFFRRLTSISQLGLVAFVYPGAQHSRFEHSLGVYRNALLFLERLIQSEDFRSRCTSHECQLFLVAALLHDIGHFPFAHVIEDLQLPELARHEARATEFLNDDLFASILTNEFDIRVSDLLELLAPQQKNLRFPLLNSLLSGPIDIDKLDYLQRDSLHAGVPYGQNFDPSRLISQLCVDTEKNKLALTHKARTAAEMMVFARYVMFSEVYWHHAVRSATAMLQRCVFQLPTRAAFLKQVGSISDVAMTTCLLQHAQGTEVETLADRLFGPERKLYKRVAQFDITQYPALHSALARRPYKELVELSGRLAMELSAVSGKMLKSTDILIDAPPQKLEVQFDVRIRQPDGHFESLDKLSPIVRTLATEQFDNIVKRVRVFATPKVTSNIKPPQIAEILLTLIE